MCILYQRVAIMASHNSVLWFNLFERKIVGRTKDSQVAFWDIFIVEIQVIQARGLMVAHIFETLANVTTIVLSLTRQITTNNQIAIHEILYKWHRTQLIILAAPY